jgi:hypothetical protein
VTKVGIFTRNRDDDVVTTDGRDDVLTRDRPVESDRVVEDRRGDWGGPPLVRALFTLLGVAAAGLLVWLAHYFDLTSTTEFWYAMGLIAAAGLVLGLSQLFGGWTKWGIPVMSPGVFLFAFIPTLIVVGWVLLATQPDGGWQQNRFSGWSGDLGITGFVNDLGMFPAALALGLGVVFAFSFDTTGRRADDRSRSRDRLASALPRTRGAPTGAPRSFFTRARDLGGNRSRRLGEHGRRRPQPHRGRARSPETSRALRCPRAHDRERRVHGAGTPRAGSRRRAHESPLPGAHERAAADAAAGVLADRG